jgi:carbon monoxide dehydrogenase subunit G
MDMTGEYRINAPRQRVWEALNDPEMLRQCIPGAETVTKLSDTEFTAEAVIKLGPVKAKFGGKVTLSDIDPPNGYTISGEGQGGAAGFGKGGAKVSLVEEGPSITMLHYAAEAQVGGKLAQIGSRLIQGSAKKLADDFFAKFAAVVEGAGPAADASPPDGSAASERGAEAAVLEAESNPELSTAVAPLAPEATSSGPADPAPAPARAGLRPLVWIPLVILVVLLLVVLARM